MAEMTEGRIEKEHPMAKALKIAAALAVLGPPCILAAAEPKAGSPASWAPAEETKVRELLGKLKLDDPLLKQWLPNVKARCQMLARPGKYKKTAAREYVRAMLEDLAAGVAPWKRWAGKSFGYPYHSPALGEIELLWITVPETYDPARSYPLWMYHKTGSGSHFRNGKAAGGYGEHTKMYTASDSFHAWSSIYRGAKGRMGLVYELREAPPALAEDFAVDIDRVFLTGWSDGGFTSFWLGSRYPHLVAGIAPNCANWQYSNVNFLGLYNVPTLIVDGWSDGGYVQSNFRRWQSLRGSGYDNVECLFGHFGHSQKPHQDPEMFKWIADWAGKHKRNPWPKRVRFATWNLSWPRAFWFTIRQVVNPALAARFDAVAAEGNVIEATTWNVASFKLHLGEELVDPRRPVTVRVNGREAYRGPFEPRLLVRVVDLPKAKYARTDEMPGGIAAQYQLSTYDRRGFLAAAHRRWLTVRPTGGSDAVREAMAKWAGQGGRADTELSDADIAGRHLRVFGTPATNRFLARIADDLPVTFEPGKFRIGKRVYDRPTACVAFIHPNPANPKKYVVVYAANDPVAAARHGFFGIHKQSPWTFRTGDCLVRGLPLPRGKWGVPARRPRFGADPIIFDSAFRPPDFEPLGEATRAFGVRQFHRLKADAIREATGADVGLVAGLPGGWTWWRTRLPAGPVTLNDLATFEMCPEHVLTFKTTGEVLKGILERAAASTVLADEADPSYDPKTSLLMGKIDPAGTYTVAAPRLPLAWSGNARQAPKLFHWRTPEEFTACEALSLPLRDARYTDIQSVEAIAAYVRKRGRVAPRPVCFDLTQYLIDPEVNAFGAMDWLHLGIDGDWAALDGGKPAPCRYVLNLGLRAADAPTKAPPREHAKQFADLPAEAAAEVDFGKLDAKLPVMVRAGSRELTFGAEEQAADAEAAGAAKAAIKVRLIDVRLINRGRKDIAAFAALTQMSQGRRHPNVFTADGKAYVGVLRNFRDPTDAVMLAAGPADSVGAIVAPGAGWNAGLMGVRRAFTLKAGRTDHAAVLFVYTAAKAKSADHGPLKTALKRIDERIRKALSQE